MNNYQINQTSHTTGTMVMAGILASHLLAGYPTSTPMDEARDSILNAPYRTKSALPSFDHIRNIFGGDLNERPDSFVESISNFYAKLVTSQEPLGAEFSRVLHENLWDLYER